VIHLDTSFLIRGLARNSPEDQQLRTWIREGTALGISAISWAEFLCGPVRANAVELATVIVHEPVPFVAADSTRTAQLFELAGRRRGSLADCMIAATAMRVGASLATANLSDFSRFAAAGLRIVGAATARRR
jgi:predicted nucleic acid-binding protein